MKKMAFCISSFILLLVVITTPNAMAQNKIKSIKYMNHKYKGVVNSNKIPDGEGELEMFGVKGLIRGLFRGNYVENATINAGRIVYSGSLTFDESNNITLKAGGTFLYYYFLDPKNYDSTLKESYGDKTVSEQLTSDKTVGIGAFDVLEKAIYCPRKLVDEREVPFVPIIARLKTRQFEYTDYVKDFLDHLNKVVRSKRVYVLDIEPVEDSRFLGFKDEKGRLWDFYGKGKYKVTYPDGSFHYEDTRTPIGHLSNYEEWTINIPEVGVAEYADKFVVSALPLCFKLRGGIEVYCQSQNELKFDELILSKDFSKIKWHRLCVKFKNINPENISEKEVEKLLQENIVPLLGENRYEVISDNSFDNVIGYYEKFDKDGFAHDGCNYSYLSKETIDKKTSAYRAKEEAKEKKENAKVVAYWTKRFGFNPFNKSASQLISVGRSFSVVLDFVKNYYVQGCLYYFSYYEDRGVSKSYYIYKVGRSNTTRVGRIIVSNDRISYVRWN